MAKCPICREKARYVQVSRDEADGLVWLAFHPTRRARLRIDNLKFHFRVNYDGMTRKEKLFHFNINAFEAYLMGTVLLDGAIRDKAFGGYWTQRGKELGSHGR